MPALPSGLKTFIVQYRNAEGIKRRINIGGYGVITSNARATWRKSSSAKSRLAKTRPWQSTKPERG